MVRDSDETSRDRTHASSTSGAGTGMGDVIR